MIRKPKVDILIKREAGLYDVHVRIESREELYRHCDKGNDEDCIHLE